MLSHAVSAPDNTAVRVALWRALHDLRKSSASLREPLEVIPERTATWRLPDNHELAILLTVHLLRRQSDCVSLLAPSRTPRSATAPPVPTA